MSKIIDEKQKIIKLNVGGIKFMTTVETLNNAPGSLLQRMFDSSFDLPPRMDDGSVFIDRDPALFEYILEYYRCLDTMRIYRLSRSLRIALHRESEYFALHGLQKLIEDTFSKCSMCDISIVNAPDRKQTCQVDEKSYKRDLLHLIHKNTIFQWKDKILKTAEFSMTNGFFTAKWVGQKSWGKEYETHIFIFDQSKKPLLDKILSKKKTIFINFDLSEIEILICSRGCDSKSENFKTACNSHFVQTRKWPIECDDWVDCWDENAKKNFDSFHDHHSDQDSDSDSHSESD